MTWSIPQGVAYVETEEAVWISRLHETRILALGPTAAAIWFACLGASTLAEVVNFLDATYSWPPADIEPHVREFVSQLVGVGLLEEDGCHALDT